MTDTTPPPASPEPSRDDEKTLALSRELDRLGRELEKARDEARDARREAAEAHAQSASTEAGLLALKGLFKEVAGDTARVARTVTAMRKGEVPGGPGGKPGEAPACVPSWLTIVDPGAAGGDPSIAIELLTDLGEWLDAVYLRYRGAGPLASCWSRHEEVVEELMWLRHTWQEAFEGPTAAQMRVGEWHDRLRPGVVARVKDYLDGCALEMHVPGARGRERSPAAPKAATPLLTSIEAVATEWATRRAQPEPTDQELHEAHEHDFRSHRREDPTS